ncbi:hypothetical protein QRX50_06655 [Amycolatopsis carbonis]|uniref:Uncharacterized protein n=1 Tax=Amycolatopsis carbonis TaxID=715471 RepID=A0A9Y2II08_9PSEU|nr:hypothetical protein [Amycolatopsis sp. 2-15]WIX80452.1 hypothetical protein QRX50_06655 [Amycolatopsis sp. 2-15]
MLRTAERRATSPADELLDRTGILAASVPRGRRSPEDTQPIPVVPALLPIAGDGASATVLAPLATAPLRPRAVARRRTRGWVAGTAALALLALGWFAGGLFSGSFIGRTTDDVAVPTDQHELVAPAAPPAPASTPAAPVAPPAAPVTVYVPVPDHKAATPAKQHVASRPTTPRTSGSGSDHRPTSTPDDEDLRSDTKSTPAKSPAATKFDQYMSQWQPWIDLADRMSRR